MKTVVKTEGEGAAKGGPQSLALNIGGFPFKIKTLPAWRLREWLKCKCRAVKYAVSHAIKKDQLYRVCEPRAPQARADLQVHSALGIHLLSNTTI